MPDFITYHYPPGPHKERKFLPADSSRKTMDIPNGAIGVSVISAENLTQAVKSEPVQTCFFGTAEQIVTKQDLGRQPITNGRALFLLQKMEWFGWEAFFIDEKQPIRKGDIVFDLNSPRPEQVYPAPNKGHHLRAIK